MILWLIVFTIPIIILEIFYIYRIKYVYKQLNTSKIEVIKKRFGDSYEIYHRVGNGFYITKRIFGYPFTVLMYDL